MNGFRNEGALGLAVLTFILAISALPLNAQGVRPLDLEDILANESMREVAQSPVRDEVVVVIDRAPTDHETYAEILWVDERRSDLWLVDGEGRARNLTNGVRDGSSWFRPVWSPDGERLAMLSTQGGDNVRLYLWEREGDSFRRLVEDGVNWRGHMHEGGGSRFDPIAWLDAHTLLVPVVAPGERTYEYRNETESRRLASEAWSNVPGGIEPTADVLRGGSRARPLPMEAPGGALVRIDLLSGEVRRLVEGDARHVLISPDRSRAAVILVTATRLPDPDEPVVQWDMWASRLAMVDLTGALPQLRIDEVVDPRLGYPEVPHRWSPDSRQIAVFSGWADPGEASRTGVELVGRDGTVRNLNPAVPGGITAVDWTGDGTLAVRSASLAGARADWWQIDIRLPEMPPRSLTAALPAVPVELFRFPGDRWVGVADGVLHSLRNGVREDLHLDLSGRVSSIVWPADRERIAGRAERLILSVRGEDGTFRYVLVESDGSALRALDLPRPRPRGLLQSYRPESGFVSFRALDPDGSFFWVGKADQPVLALHRNSHLAGVREAEKRIIEYRSMDGQPLNALLMLPSDYQPGTRIPMVTVVYAGEMVGSIATMSEPINSIYYNNWQLLTSRGFAVLVPSIPIPTGDRADQFLEIPKGVLPAVERVVEMGIADSDRIGLMGQSHGGYTVYALVAFTRRFRAAVATHGSANLVTQYGLFDARFRYSGGPVESVFQQAHAESGQGQMGVAPYTDFWRYIRNSPLFYIDRVETPLMLVYGDNDFVGMQQGEEVFTALHRLGRPVEFVRYWGEGHANVSPANIRDYWTRLYDWFEEHLRAPD